MNEGGSWQVSRRKVLGYAVLAGTATLLPGSIVAYGRAAIKSLEESGMASRIEAFIKGWDTIGEHRTGTEGDRQTALWLAGYIEQFGGEPHLQGFPFVRREFTQAYLQIHDTRIEGLPCFDTLPQTDPVAGKLGELASEAPLGVGEFMPNAPSPYNQPMYAARQAAQHLGIVVIAAGAAVRPGLAVVNAESYSEPYGPPVLQVGTEHRDQIKAAMAKGVEGRLVISETQHETEAYNVQVAVPGQRPELAPVVVMTPRSGWWHSTSERGGGIAAWLEAIRSLLAEPARRPVLFTANTGHELGHVGMKAFQSKYPGLDTSAHCWVHLGANFAAAGGGVRYQASDARLMELGLTQLRLMDVDPDMITPQDDRPFGEARDIFDAGGRYVSLLGSNPLFHHPDDRWPEAVDLAKTERATQAMVSLIRALANQES